MTRVRTRKSRRSRTRRSRMRRINRVKKQYYLGGRSRRYKHKKSRKKNRKRRGTRAHRRIIRGGTTSTTKGMLVRVEGQLEFFQGVYRKNQKLEDQVKQARARCHELITNYYRSIDPKTTLPSHQRKVAPARAVARARRNINDKMEHFAKFFKENENDSNRKYWFSEDGQYRLECIMGGDADFIRKVNVTNSLNFSPYNIKNRADDEHPSEHKSQGAYILSVNNHTIPNTEVDIKESEWLLSWIPKLYKVPQKPAKYIVESREDEGAEFFGEECHEFKAENYSQKFEVIEEEVSAPAAATR